MEDQVTSKFDQNTEFEFFAICLPGLEHILKQELEILIPDTEFTEQNGGFSFKTKAFVGFGLNKYLRSCTRILMRLHRFKCRDLPKLYNKTKTLPLSQFIVDPNAPIHISTYKSRLFDDRKIELTLRDALKKAIESQAPKKEHIERSKTRPAPALYFRIDNDLATVSVDTTGERLDRRTPGKHKGGAPLRETLAYAIAKKAKECSPSIQTLWDPFCGSGTILIESLRSEIQREYYAYDSFASGFLTIQAEFEKNKTLFEKAYGSDLDSHAVEAALNNTSDLNATIIQQDILETMVPPTDEDIIIITNPPYGKLVKKSREDLMDLLLNKIKDWKNIKATYVLYPEKGLRNEKILTTSNGGIKVSLFKI